MLPICEKILLAWKDEGETLRYKQIKHFAITKGIISETNDRSLSRWLKKLVEAKLLEKSENGYILKSRPKAYQVFDYINELRQKSVDQIYDGEVGGLFSHVCALTYLSFDEKLIETEEERIAFNAISVRIGALFWALYQLRNRLLKRRCGLPNLKLPDEVIRETFFEKLVRSIGEHHATEEIVEKFFENLIPVEKENFSRVWNINRVKSDRDYESLLEDDFFSDKIGKDLQSYKKQLKKERSIDLDKQSAEELLEKLCQIKTWIFKKHEKEMEEKHCFSYTKEESELEANYRTAVLIKTAEGIKARHATTEDFAVIVTRHPETLNEYYTPEHILHEAIEWAKKPPDDDWGKDIWNEIREEEKTFEGMVAERLVLFGGRFPVRTYAKMRLSHWLKKELNGFGDFQTILKLYSKKRRIKLCDDRKKRNLFLDEISDSLNDETQKPLG